MEDATYTIAEALRQQRRAFIAQQTPTPKTRSAQLGQLLAMLNEGQDALVAAVSADFVVRRSKRA